MIDIENKVFNEVAVALGSYFPSAVVYSDYVDLPSAFPCVTVVEESNTTHTNSQDNNLKENHADLLYTVNIYSNLKNGSKSQAKELMNVVDDTMQNLKFTRTYCQPTPNINSTIYRITARYTATVGKGKTDGTTTTYQMYRK